MFSSFKSLSLLASLVSAAAIAEPALVSRQTTCAAGLHLMIAGGCAIPCLADVPSLLSTLIGNLTTTFPGTDQYYVPYGNVQSQAQVSTPVMIAAAKQYAVDCPDTPIVFIGYSLGGIIVMNTLCGGLSAQYVPNVLAAITYGEETFRYPMSYDAGTCTTLAPLYPRNNTDLCTPYAPVIQNICSATDPNCCKGGLDYLSHYTYPQFYDLQMLAYVKAKYAALQATKTSATSTTSSTSTTSTSTSTTVTSTTVSTVSTAVSTTVSTAVSTTISTTASTSTTTISATASTSTTTASTTASTSTTTVSAGVSTDSATTVSAGVSSASTVSTTASAASTRSTITIVSTVSTASTTTVRFSNSTAVIPVSYTSVTTTRATTTYPAVVTTFPDIPNSAILVASSVQASYLPVIVTAVPSGSTVVQSGTVLVPATSGVAASAATTAAGSATTAAGSGTKTTAAVTAYTGAATRATGIALAAVAGLAAAVIAI